MHQDEMWQVYALNGEPIPEEGWNSALDNPEKTGSDAIVGVAIVLLYRHCDDSKVEVLWQKRSDKVNRFPGEYDYSAGGHINLGESLVEAAVREAREEIGVELSANDLYFLTTRPLNKNRFAWIYLVDWTGKPDDFHFDDEEVAEVKWVPFEESDEFRVKYGKEPLKKDDITFKVMRQWFIEHGDL